jgi:hypothetical protein
MNKRLYEPDARVCPLCERVYFKRSVPNKCKCGNDIHALRPATIEEPEDLADDFYDSQDEEEEEREDEELDEADGDGDGDGESDAKGSSKKVKAAEDAET